jgi:hypothetical protein
MKKQTKIVFCPGILEDGTCGSESVTEGTATGACCFLCSGLLECYSQEITGNKRTATCPKNPELTLCSRVELPSKIDQFMFLGGRLVFKIVKQNTRSI